MSRTLRPPGATGPATFAANQKARADAAAALEASEAAELSKRFGAKLDGTLKELQSVALSSSAPPSLFDPKSQDFLGVHAVTLFAKILERVPRGEDKTRQLFGEQERRRTESAAYEAYEC